MIDSMAILRRASPIVAVLSLSGVSSVAAQFTEFESAIARFDAEVANGVAQDAGGAVSVAIFRGGEVVWQKGYGWADIKNHLAADAWTIGRTGSISKTFTAVLMMQLAERGVIDLDEPVVNHLPAIAELVDPPVNVSTLTFRMLASHTAGLVREPALEGAADGPIFGWEGKIMASIPRTGFKTPPLTEYSYSNIGYGILGLALSRAAGVPFMDLMETLIFDPLGLSSTTFILDSPDLWARMSVGYDRDRATGTVSSELATREHFGRGYKVPNGGVYSTVGDLAVFAAALMGEAPVQILSDDSRLNMQTAQPPATGYGLGLQITDGEQIPLFGHGGSVAGYNADFRFDPETRLGVAMLRTTSYNPPMSGLLRALIVADRSSH